MIRKLRFGSRRIVLAGLLIVIVSWGRLAGAQMIGVPTNDAVRGEVVITNTTGLTVNDLEMMVCTKEGTPILGFSGTASGFANTTAVFDPNMPGCVDVKFDGGDVAPGQVVDINLTSFLANKNMMKITDATWTIDNRPVGLPPIPPGGFIVQPPKPPGGGGGGGGGGGMWTHEVIIDNDKDESVTLSDLKLLASMQYYNSLSGDVPWGTVSALDFGGGATSIVIAAHSSFTYDFQTLGSFVGGHIYLNYSIDDPIIWYGDHPVVPEPGSALLLALGAPAVLVVARSRRARRGA